jgi:hypothetical protein
MTFNKRRRLHTSVTAYRENPAGMKFLWMGIRKRLTTLFGPSREAALQRIDLTQVELLVVFSLLFPNLLTYMNSQKLQTVLFFTFRISSSRLSAFLRVFSFILCYHHRTSHFLDLPPDGVGTCSLKSDAEPLIGGLPQLVRHNKER